MSQVLFDGGFYNPTTTTSILGTMRDGKPTFMALAWFSRITFKPATFAIGVATKHETHPALIESGEFSICIPSVKMVEVADYVGITSARSADKSDLFEVFYGELKNAPLIKDCPLNLALKVQMQIGCTASNSIFIGELVEAWCEESCLVNGKPDMLQVDPILLTMPDNQYWRMGEKIADAWKVGTNFKK